MYKESFAVMQIISSGIFLFVLHKLPANKFLQLVQIGIF